MELQETFSRVLQGINSLQSEPFIPVTRYFQILYSMKLIISEYLESEVGIRFRNLQISHQKFLDLYSRFLKDLDKVQNISNITSEKLEMVRNLWEIHVQEKLPFLVSIDEGVRSETMWFSQQFVRYYCIS